MQNKTAKKRQSAQRRAKRTRVQLHGTAKRPRLSVFRSLKHISAQLIDDDAGRTLAASSDKQVDAKGKKPVEIATLVGTDITARAKELKVKTVIFDRGAYRYHGRVKALAEAARAGGLEF